MSAYGLLHRNYGDDDSTESCTACCLNADNNYTVVNATEPGLKVETKGERSILSTWAALTALALLEFLTALFLVLFHLHDRQGDEARPKLKG